MPVDQRLSDALDKLGAEFANKDWKFCDVPPGSPWENAFVWPGTPEEEIKISVHQGTSIQELFHRQDFFFFNFAYLGSFDAYSCRDDNYITINEGEGYMSQPFVGYALNKTAEEEFIIIAVLIRKDTFSRTFLPTLSSDPRLFRFFLNPQTNQYSDEFIRLKFDDETLVRRLLELMTVEYAFPQEGTQSILKPLTLALLMEVARQYKKSAPEDANASLADQIAQYMGEHIGTATLKDIAGHFAYHPNYISGLLHRELGKTFSQLLLEQRMERAVMLLKGTDLSIEEIAAMLGYSNSSNFLKAFRMYYHMSPREFVHLQ